MQGTFTKNPAARVDFPSSLELKRLSLAIYHGDPACAERCRDATVLAILAHLLERRVEGQDAVAGIAQLRRCDYSAGNGVLKVAGEKLELRRDWLSAAMRWLVFRGLREGPLFLRMVNRTVVDQALAPGDVLAIIDSWTQE